MTITPNAMDQDDEFHPRFMVFTKMESIIREMQLSDTGIPIKCQKLFLTTIPAVFSGCDLVEWLMGRLRVEESDELLHLATLFCRYGYIIPVTEKSLTVKYDSTLYRFQSPYFWVSQNWDTDLVDYAIYLAKRSMRNKQKHGLDDNEQVIFNKLQKMLCDKWDFVYMQAEEQLRLAKERKKADKAILDSQEEAFWRVHRPLLTHTNHLCEGVRRHSKPCCRQKTNAEACTKQIAFLKYCLRQPRMKTSKTIDSMFKYCQQYEEHDPFLTTPQPSNPWITEDTTLWVLNTMLVDTPTERRVRCWSFSLRELLSDVTGQHYFRVFLDKEYSSENIRFWSAVEELSRLPQSQVAQKVHEIYREFIAPGAIHEINIDSKTMEETMEALKKPSNYTFEKAQAHIFLLMNKDSYQRFLRSDDYKNLLSNAINPCPKKKFFGFGIKKKSPQPSPQLTRRGSTSNTLNGADSRLDTNTLSQHSYSTGNLQDLDVKSGKTSPFGSAGDVHKKSVHRSLSPSSFMKKLNDLVRSDTSVRSNLEVPVHYSSPDSVQSNGDQTLPEMLPSANINIVVPNSQSPRQSTSSVEM